MSYRRQNRDSEMIPRELTIVVAVLNATKTKQGKYVYLARDLRTVIY